MGTHRIATTRLSQRPSPGPANTVPPDPEPIPNPGPGPLPPPPGPPNPVPTPPRQYPTRLRLLNCSLEDAQPPDFRHP